MATLTDDLERTQRARAHFEDLIANPEQLGPDFQPVRRLADDEVVGWQAVGKGNVGPELSDRATFAATAVALGLAERLDWTFRCRILDVAAEHDVTLPIHLRAAFASYGTVPPPRLAVAFARGRRRDVVVEIHPDAYAEPDRLSKGVNEFRLWGWQIAVGDVSARPDSTSLLQRLKPAIAHVDLTAPGRSADDGVKRYVETAQRLGVTVLATGLDNPLRRSEAEQLGATFGRGNALGTPGDPVA